MSTSRQPAGQPTGGQFAPTSGSDAGLDLAEPADAIDSAERAQGKIDGVLVDVYATSTGPDSRLHGMTLTPQVRERERARLDQMVRDGDRDAPRLAARLERADAQMKAVTDAAEAAGIDPVSVLGYEPSEDDVAKAKAVWMAQRRDSDLAQRFTLIQGAHAWVRNRR